MTFEPDTVKLARGEMLTTAQVAELTGVAAGTLRRWRCDKTGGPRSFTLGSRKVVYRRADVEAWLNAQYAEALEAEKEPAA